MEKLGLSYHNIRGLHQKVDSIPERSGIWQTKHLSFNDKPDEKYTIRFRNPIDAIKSLWKDPELSPTMVFCPGKAYSDTEKKNRIFSEMWTSKWWHVCQVMCVSFSFIIINHFGSSLNYLEEQL